MGSETKARGLKEKAAEEFKVFLIVFGFLAAMYCVFITYRRLILTEFGIGSVHYAVAFIEAAIIAKVMLVGQMVGLGRRVESQPLIITVPLKALLYGLLVGLFGVLERIIEGLAHGKDWEAIVHSFLSIGIYELLARTLMVIFTFIPFFAIWELDRVLGEGKLFALFFKRRAS